MLFSKKKQSMKIHCETPRFILRELEETDAEGIFELDSNPEVHKYLGNNPIKTVQEAKNIIEHVRKQYLDNGIGRWAIVDKSTNEFIGWAGMKWNTEPFNNQQYFYDIGYRLIERHWGKGIATECAIASLNYGYEALNAKKLVGIAHIDNIGSNKILQSIGLKHVEAFNHEGDDCNWYELTREEWESTITHR